MSKTDVPSMTYAGTGVDYASMDPFKVAAQEAASRTRDALERLGLSEVSWSRGESAYLIEMPDGSLIAHVEEGLGTKNLVADAMRDDEETYYDHIAQDGFAMIINDLITVGALPISAAMHLAVGDSAWFEDDRRSLDLINGWRRACEVAGCAWGGGETPTLKGIVIPGTVVLSGSAIGLVQDRRDLIRSDNLEDGDRIVLLASSGIHANGLTLARKIAEMLPMGFQTPMHNGAWYGHALLEPTIIYAPVIEACQQKFAQIHYAVNITGHGWRKLMRARQPFTYVIERVPPVPPVLQFMCEQGPITNEEAYGNLNMGAGFALMVPPHQVNKVLDTAERQAIKAYDAGYVKRGAKKVVIEPLGITYEAASLAVR